MRRTFRYRPYAVQEYPNDDDNGYLTEDDEYHSETEATVPWNPDVEYPTAYVHLSWCRRSCGCRCNPNGRAQDFPAYRHSDSCRGGCRNTCADNDNSAAQVPAVDVVRPEGGWGKLGHGGDVDQAADRDTVSHHSSYYCGSPYYAPTEGDTSGHYGDVDQAADGVSTVSCHSSCCCSTPRYAPTEGDTAASYDLSPVTPESARGGPESEGSGAESEAELTCLMADVAPNDRSQSKESDKGERDSKFSWSLLQDGTGVVVHVQGAPKVVVTPDPANRRFNADFAADTGLNGNPAARAQMNVYMQKAAPETADELGRQLKEARKTFRGSSGDKSGGWRLLESDHCEFARNVIAAYFVADRALTNEVISDLPAQELKRTITAQASALPVFFDTGANCTIAPRDKALELGLHIEAGTEATVLGVGGPQQTDGMTVFPSLVKAVMHGKTVDANIKLKAQVMPGPSTKGKDQA